MSTQADMSSSSRAGLRDLMEDSESSPQPSNQPTNSTKTMSLAPTNAVTPVQQPTWNCGRPGACYFSESITFMKEICKTLPAVCPKKDCRTVRGMYDVGKVLKADVNSFSYGSSPNHPPVVTVAAECCHECKRDKRCNVWNFCGKDGCGYKNSCTTFYEKYPAGPGKKNLRGIFPSGCSSQGRFSRGSCILRQASEKQLATVKPKGPITFTSGRLA